MILTSPCNMIFKLALALLMNSCTEAENPVLFCWPHLLSSARVLVRFFNIIPYPENLSSDWYYHFCYANYVRMLQFVLFLLSGANKNLHIGRSRKFSRKKSHRIKNGCNGAREGKKGSFFLVLELFSKN